MELNEWVERCKVGDKEAQAWLYKTYSQKMLRICRGWVSDRQVALDLMHDGFVLIFASIGSLRQAAKLESWMGRIMTNLSLRYLNQQPASSMLPLSELPEDEEPADVEAVPEVLPLDVLLAMIEQLPDGYRRIFKLSVLDGLSHKEIAELLHIAPHSSSSQFFRAKEYLKRMIIEHRAQLLLILLLFLPLGYLLWYKDLPVTLPVPASEPVPDMPALVDLPKDTIPASPQAECRRICTVVVAVTPLAVDTGTVSSDEIPAVVDSSGSKPAIRLSKESSLAKEHTTHKQEKMTVKLPQKSNWLLALRYSNGQTSQGTAPVCMTVPPNDASSGADKKKIDNWDDYYHYLRQSDIDWDMNSIEEDLLQVIARRNKGKKLEERVHHELPLTIGLMLQKTVDRHWSVESGLQYTRLVSDFTRGEGAYIYEQQRLHYIGIPLRGVYRLGQYKRFSFYSSAGVTMEIPVSPTKDTEYIIDGISKYNRRRALKLPLQWSVDGGVGVQYQLLPSVGIFAEPRLNYYFNDGSEVKTLRKEHPFGVTLPVGIRWTY